MSESIPAATWRRRCAVALLILGPALPSQMTGQRAIAAEATPKVTYDDQVLAILRNRCASCHNPDKASSDLDVMSYSQLLAGGASGEVLVPGDPDASRLFRLVAHAEEPKMPPKAAKLPDEELAVLRGWIEGGLLEKAGGKAKTSARPKANLALSAPSVGKPEGPPPMPGDLLLENDVPAIRRNAVTAIASSPWAPVVAVAGQKQVLLYHSDTLELLGVLPFSEGSIHVLKFSRNGALLLAGGGHAGKSGRVVVWNLADGSRMMELGNDELDSVLAADISSDQQMVALGGPSKLVKVYSTQTGELLHTLKKHTDWVQAIEFSPDAVLLATADRSGGLVVWESFSGLEFYTLRGHSLGVTDVSWRADSNVLASASEDLSVRLWEMENGTQIKTWNAHGGGVQSVKFTHDGRLVTCARDNLVKTWNGDGGQLVQFEPFSDLALRATFSHDGGKVIAGAWTGDIRVWNAADGQRAGDLDSNPPTIAQRLEAFGKELAALEPAAKAAAEALATAEAAATKAGEELVAAQKQAGETAAALKAASDEHAVAKPAVEKLRVDLETAKVDHVAKAARAKMLSEVTEAARKPAEETAAAAKQAAEAFDARDGVAKRLAEAAAAAKEIADKAPEDKILGEAAAAAQAAAGKAAEAANSAQTARDATALAAKAPGEAFAKAKAESDPAVAEASAAEKRLAELVPAAKTAEEAFATAEKKLADATVAATAAAKTVEEKGPFAQAVAAELEAKRAAQTQAATSLAATQARLQKWQLAEVKKNMARTRDALAARDLARQTLETARAEALARVEKAQGELTQANERLAQAPAKVAAAEAALAAAKGVAASSATEMEASKVVVVEKEGVAAPLAELVTKLEQSLAKAPENKTLGDAMVKAKESLALLGGDLEAARMVVTAQADAVAKANAGVEAAQAAFDQAKAEAEAAKVAVDGLAKQIAEGNATAEAAKVDAEKAVAEIASLQGELDRLQAHLANLTPKA